MLGWKDLRVQMRGCSGWLSISAKNAWLLSIARRIVSRAIGSPTLLRRALPACLRKGTRISFPKTCQFAWQFGRRFHLFLFYLEHAGRDHLQMSFFMERLPRPYLSVPKSSPKRLESHSPPTICHTTLTWTWISHRHLIHNLFLIQ